MIFIPHTLKPGLIFLFFMPLFPHKEKGFPFPCQGQTEVVQFPAVPSQPVELLILLLWHA